ncbi:MAG: efflux RND transporter periplasmic adaptor subunit [Gemmataceae bacterium]
MATSQLDVESAAPPSAASRPRLRVFRLVGRVLSLALSMGCLLGVAAIGRATGWHIPKASSYFHETESEPDDWCKEHGVSESGCVECRPWLFVKVKTYKWCREHGVPECPHCHPDLAEMSSVPAITNADRELASRALAFSHRDENDPKCRKHLRRLQLPLTEINNRLGISFVYVARGAVEETLSAPAEIGYDPLRVARVSPRTPGTVFRVEKQVGDKVKRGEVLALVDSAEVGRIKAEFQQAFVQFNLRRETLAKLRPMAGTTVPGKDIQAAEAAVEEAEVKLLAAWESLANLGMPVLIESLHGKSAGELSSHMQFLGLPPALVKDLAGRTRSSNLLAVESPLDGEVIARTAVRDESANTTKSLFTIADPRRMWLTLRVRPEDATRIQTGQAVRFRHARHQGSVAWDAGTVVWTSPAADERTRTVPVRVDLPNPSDRHHANTFGTAEVILRSEKAAVVVPSGAVHWDGCCHIVFVRDRDFEKDGLRVIHVRKVRIGAKDVQTPTGTMTEIAAGLLPGEQVVSVGSGLLRSELLKNDLGDGCACCKN